MNVPNVAPRLPVVQAPSLPPQPPELFTPSAVANLGCVGCSSVMQAPQLADIAPKSKGPLIAGLIIGGIFLAGIVVALGASQRPAYPPRPED